MKRWIILLLGLMVLLPYACAETYYQGAEDCYWPAFLFDDEGRLLRVDHAFFRISSDQDWYSCRADENGSNLLVNGEGKIVSDRPFQHFSSATANRIIHYEYTEDEQFTSGLIFGLIDETAQDVIPLKYGNLQRFGDNHFYTVDHEGRIILIDSDGVEHPTDKFYHAAGAGSATYPDIRENVLPAYDESRTSMGYIDPAGNWAIPPQFGYADAFENGFARVRSSDGSDLVGLIDDTGRIVVPMRYERFSIEHSIIAIQADGKTRDVYTLDGRLLFSHQGLIEFWGPGYYSFEKRMLIDPSGNEIPLPRGYAVDDGSCLVHQNNLMYVHDSNGQHYLLSQEYELLSPGYADITYGCTAGDKEIYIVTAGDTEIAGADNGGSGCGKGTHIRTVGAALDGLIDWEGNVIVPCEYDFLSHVDNSPYFACYMADQIRILDTEGNLLLEFIWSEAE